jgi:hypothetical protein
MKKVKAIQGGNAMTKANTIRTRSALAVCIAFILFSFALSSCEKDNQREAPSSSSSIPSSDGATSLDLDEESSLVKSSDNTADLDKENPLVENEGSEHSLVVEYLKAKVNSRC